MSLVKFSTLQIALSASVAVHGALLTVRFVDPESFNRVFQDTPLEVVLVNARTNEKPEKAKAIAQASMAGGGEAVAGRSTSPLPTSALSETGDAMEEESRRLQTLQEQQSLLLAQVRNQLAALPPPDPKRPAVTAEQQEAEEKRRQLIKQLAEIERRISTESARPKRRYISPSTQEKVYAIYYEAMRRAIEERGTENFPEVDGKKLYGQLTMIISVNHDGHILRTEIVSGSGNRALDRRAEVIARSAGPFDPFTPAIRAQYDQFVLVSRFKFTRDETLETRLTNQ